VCALPGSEALPAAAREGRLVTFGVVPTRPEQGFGYIRQGAGQGAARPVVEFVEKPDAARSKQIKAQVIRDYGLKGVKPGDVADVPPGILIPR